MVTEDTHSALIDRTTFQAAQTLRRQRRTRIEQSYRRGRGAKSDYLLTGLIVCGHCRHRWQGYSQWKGRRRKDGRSKLREALQDALAHEMADAGKLERLRRERDKALRKVNNILDNLTPTNREFADRRIAELQKELRALDARLAELEAKAAAQPDLDDLTDEMLGYMADFERVAAEGTVDEKRRFVRAFVQRIEIEPETQEIRLLLCDLPAPG